MRVLTASLLLLTVLALPRAGVAEPAPSPSATAPALAAPSQTVNANAPAQMPAEAAPVEPPATQAAPAEAEAPAAAPPPPPPPRVVAKIDLSEQRMTVRIDGKLVHSWPISSGRSGYYTPTGSFRPQWAARMWYSKQYDDAPMPYAVFFNGGIATHGTTYVRQLGSPASHGCVRLTTANAKTFYDLVHRYGYKATRIVVQGRTPAPVASRRRDDSNRYADRRDNGSRYSYPSNGRPTLAPPYYVPPPRYIPPRYTPYASSPYYGQGYYGAPRYPYARW